MPKALSNLDFVAFTADYPQYNAVSPSFNMQPGQSVVVNWNNSGRIILVYEGPNYININENLYPDVYYTDVSDSTQLNALQNPNYTAPPQSQLDALPQAIKDTMAQEAVAAGAMINQAGQALSQYIGSLAGNLTGPLVGNFAPVLIGALVIVFALYGPRRR